MNTDFGRIRAKVDYLLARDDVALPPNVRAEWDPEGLGGPLADQGREPADRLLDALADRHLGQLVFFGEDDRYDPEVNADPRAAHWRVSRGWQGGLRSQRKRRA